MLIGSSYIGKRSKIFFASVKCFFFEKFEKSEFLTFFKKSSKWSFLWNMTSISERALKKTGLWRFWDFQVGFLNAIFLEKEFFQKKQHIFCNFITRGKKLIKNFLSRKFNESKKLKLKNHVFYGNYHFILVYENVFGYKN